MEQEVKLVHPDDPDRKVVSAADQYQVDAFKSVGFVELEALTAREATEEDQQDSTNEVAELKAELEKAKKSLKEEKAARKQAEKAAEDAGAKVKELEAKSADSSNQENN